MSRILCQGLPARSPSRSPAPGLLLPPTPCLQALWQLQFRASRKAWAHDVGSRMRRQLEAYLEKKEALLADEEAILTDHRPLVCNSGECQGPREMWGGVCRCVDLAACLLLFATEPDWRRPCCCPCCHLHCAAAAADDLLRMKGVPARTDLERESNYRNMKGVVSNIGK